MKEFPFVRGGGGVNTIKIVTIYQQIYANFVVFKCGAHLGRLTNI